jgi:hypothetical protein
MTTCREPNQELKNPFDQLEVAIGEKHKAWKHPNARSFYRDPEMRLRLPYFLLTTLIL